MRILVLGAGVVGVTSAWYLAKDGHEVTVLERLEGPGLATSYGNAGGVCPGFAGPWATPAMPLKALRWMAAEQAPLKIRPRFDAQQWLWLGEFLRNCTTARFKQNKARMQRVAHYSMACLRALREETGIAYDNASDGILQLFSTPEEAEGGRRSAGVLESLGIAHRLVAPEDLGGIEPALANSSLTFTGGLHLTTDETGDCHLFCRALADLAAARGVLFNYGVTVERLRASGGKVTGADTDAGSFEAEAVVVAIGPWARDLLAPLGVRVPVYPVKGYSLTCEVEDRARAPRSSIMDEHSKVMVSRLGNRIRAAGVAELAGFDASMPAPVLAALRARVEALFPGAGNYAEAETWHGFRPMTPGGPSIVEPRGPRGLWLNLGHGSNGWTQACGTGQLLANRVAGRPTPEVEG
ncbi:D-amino acid dehydrogenase [Tropicimonas sediminicola]|uniref:D-amino-acid dehydrogenase n=1 Tax=Tropicimonas sediminicola TaxID=1031541 RepID=A0A239CZS4_9RHOB|nr:D-amino acid dehydrogenase [Tropicimonas sediminicola]SNS25449.1 D-amino-acid dehydrogenase [Tropicimonas sediminicola]